MRHSNGFAVRACALLAVVVATVPAVAQEVTFAYKFEPGASERSRVKLNQEVTMGQMAVSNIADMEVTVKCVSTAEGKYAMEMKFDKVDVSMSMMGNTSASPLGEQITGQTISFTADANGNVTDVKPVGVFDAWDSASQLVTPVVEGWYPHLPNKAVAVGGQWEKKGEKESDASGTETLTNASFKFKEIKKDKGGDVAVVEETLDTAITGNSATPMGTYAVMGAGKGKTEFAFDPAKSRVARIKGKIDIEMDMTPQSGGDPVKTVVINHVERNVLE